MIEYSLEIFTFHSPREIFHTTYVVETENTFFIWVSTTSIHLISDLDLYDLLNPYTNQPLVPRAIFVT